MRKNATLGSMQEAVQLQEQLPLQICRDYQAVGIPIGKDGSPIFEVQPDLRELTERIDSIFSATDLRLQNVKGAVEEARITAEMMTAVQEVWDDLARNNRPLVETLAKYSDYRDDTFAGLAVEAYRRLTDTGGETSHVAHVACAEHMHADDVNLAVLESQLAQRYPQLSEGDRLEHWIRQQKDTLAPLESGSSAAPGAYKDVFIPAYYPDIVVKYWRKFDSGNEAKKEFEEERIGYGLLHGCLTDEFLVPTQFVVTEGEKGSAEYVALQDKQHGLHYKSLLSDTAKELSAIRREQGEAAYQATGAADTMLPFVSGRLASRFSPEAWSRLQDSAGRLVTGLELLEAGSLRLRDIDFFITRDLEIKLTDYMVFDTGSPTHKRTPCDEVKGLEEIKTIFGI